MTRLIRSTLLHVCLMLSVLLAGVLGVSAQEATETAVEASEAVTTLLDTLKDDAAREALIAELEKAAGTATTEATDTSEALAEDPPLFGDILNEFVTGAADNAASWFSKLLTSFQSAKILLGNLNAETWGVVWAATLDLALVIAITVGVFVGLRILTVPLLRGIGREAQGQNLLRSIGAIVLSIVIRIAVVITAWAIAFGVVTLLTGTDGEIGLRQSLFLNAFLIVELAKVAVRSILSPAASDLRGLPMSDAAAKRTTRIAAIAISILGYGLLLVVPVVDEALSFFSARAISVLTVELTLVWLALSTFLHRVPVGTWLVDTILGPGPEDASGVPMRRSGVLAGLLRRWYIFALAYFALLFVQVFTRSVESLGLNVLAVFKIAGVAFGGAVILRFLAQRARDGIDIPARIEKSLPRLEGRVNNVFPRIMMVLRALIGIAVVIFALDTMGLTSTWEWLQSDRGGRFFDAIVSVGLILLVAWVLWLALASWVDFRLDPDHGRTPSSREMTLLALFRNAVTIAIVIFTVMFALSEIGLNIGPLIASAGVLGLAIGFGAQKLVQDIITGVFIQFENAINVGDVITVAGITGGVEKLTIRSVSLRDLHGAFHIVPFSSVDMVTNFTREFSYFVIDMGVGYGEDVDAVQKAMEDSFDALREDDEQGLFILGDLEFFGVQAFGDSAVTVRARIKTWPGKQWGVGRAYNKVLKRIFDERGIEIPYPHQTVVFADQSDETGPAKLTEPKGS